MKTKTQVFRLLRTRGFSASHLRSNLSEMKAMSKPFSVKFMSSFIQQTEMLCSAHRAVWPDRPNSIRHVVKEIVIGDKVTVAAQDTRVKK